MHFRRNYKVERYDGSFKHNEDLDSAWSVDRKNLELFQTMLIIVPVGLNKDEA